MGKTAATLHKEIQKARPVYRIMRKLHTWYEDHPFTGGEKSVKIQKLHDAFSAKGKILDIQHRKELQPLIDQIEAIKKDAMALGEKHRAEKESYAMAYAIVELDLLKDVITELPKEIFPVSAEPNGVIKRLEKLLEK